MNFARFNALYWTSNLTNTNSDGSYVDADINETFTSNLLENGGDYICAVERLELNLNGVPYYDGEYEGESIEIRATGADGVNPVDGLMQTINVTFKSYSLKNTIDQLNIMLAAEAVNSTTTLGAFVFSLDADGFVTLSRTNSTNFYTVFPNRLNQILGLYNEVAGETNWISGEPRWDIGDSLQHIRLTSNLNLVSDTVGQAKTNILTDLSVNSSLSASSNGGYSYSSRDKMIYTPSEHRYLNFNSSAPVQIIRIVAEYVQPDNTSRVVQLPVGASFNIKLGFYQRI
jgi:hypothetical protein